MWPFYLIFQYLSITTQKILLDISNYVTYGNTLYFEILNWFCRQKHTKHKQYADELKYSFLRLKIRGRLSVRFKSILISVSKWHRVEIVPDKRYNDKCVKICCGPTKSEMFNLQIKMFRFEYFLRSFPTTNLFYWSRTNFLLIQFKRNQQSWPVQAIKLIEINEHFNSFEMYVCCRF